MDNLNIAYCGIDCQKCKNYKKNMNCAGCRHELELLEDCPTRICCSEKGFLHCSECNEFPCEELKCFYNDGNPLHLQAFETLKSL